MKQFSVRAPNESELSFPRHKPSDPLISIVYRAGRLSFRLAAERTLGAELRLSRVLARLAFEHAGRLYGEAFHNATMGLAPETLREWIPSQGSVLDIGCGTGRISRLVSPYALDVLGIDADAAAIDIARGRTSAPNVRFEIGNANEELRGPFDIVILSHVLEHIEHPDRLLSRLHDVAPSLIINVPRFGKDGLDYLRLYLGLDFSGDADHVREYTPAILDEQLRRNGWQPRLWSIEPTAVAVLAANGGPPRPPVR